VTKHGSLRAAGLTGAALLAAGLWSGAALAAAHGVRVNCDVNPGNPDCEQRTLPTPKNQDPVANRAPPPAAEQAAPKTGK